ncbi:MAG: hypothetical protein JNL82_34195 [Myxococcales bacterium]|nr:hypothetical protein [Myxococcales bacterium]
MRGGWVVVGVVGSFVCACKAVPVAVALEPEAAETVAAEPPRSRPVFTRALDGSAEPLECFRPEQFGPVRLSPDQWLRRRGAGVTDLRRLRSSKDRPVEVCNVRGEQDFLLSVRCADGRPPFNSSAEVARARTGSVGSGGRCHTIIDLYEVTCAEATYAVYMDMYMCPEGSSFR